MKFKSQFWFVQVIIILHHTHSLVYLFDFGQASIQLNGLHNYTFFTKTCALEVVLPKINNSANYAFLFLIERCIKNRNFQLLVTFPYFKTQCVQNFNGFYRVNIERLKKKEQGCQIKFDIYHLATLKVLFVHAQSWKETYSKIMKKS